MYKEEQLINGVLHWRGDPDGEFQPYSLRDLSSMYLQARDTANEHKARIVAACEILLVVR